MRHIEKIIIHCSATPAGRDVKAADIDCWHRDRGYKSIGYHYVIRLDGSVEKGRDEHDTGAHCRGHNASSIGICYIGGCDRNMNPADTRTPLQRQSIRRLVSGLLKRYPQATVHGHNEMTCRRAQNEAGFKSAECSLNCAVCKFSAKACPCFNVKAEFT